MINPTTGKKMVVTAGSPEASAAFGQGFYLMGKDGKAVGYTAPGSSPTTSQPVTGGPADTAAVPGTPNATTTPTATTPTATTPTATTTPSTTGSTRTATVYGPAGERKVVTAGSAEASGYLARGWTLTQGEASGKRKATLYGPNGEKRVVFTGTQEASDLLGQGYTLNKPTSPITTSTDLRSTDRQTETNNAIDAITNTMTGGQEAPTPPDLVGDWQKYREQYGVTAIEGKITDLDKRIGDLDTQYLAGKHDTRDQLAPMSVIGGRQLQLQDQYNEQRSVLTNERNSYVSQLTSANNTISTIMSLTGQQYEWAAGAYNDNYNRNYQAYTIYNQQQSQERADANANLTTITNMMSESGKTWGDLSTAQQANIQSLELRAGLPEGTISAFMSQKPKAKLIATTEGYDSAGNGIVSMIYEDENGLPGVVRTVKTGTHKAPTGDAKTLKDQLQDDFENGMSYEDAQKYYPEFKGTVIDKIYGKDDSAPLFPETTTTTTTNSGGETISSGTGTKKKWWEFWK